MNPVLVLTHNNLALTMKAASSVMSQWISRPTLYIIDNGSTDGTQDCIFGPGTSLLAHFETNEGVSHGWNHGLSFLFDSLECDHVLVANNDVILPAWYYAQLLEYDKPFISGVSVDKMDQIQSPAPMGPLHPHPDFSGFLIKKEVWDIVGKFDESMKHYASDNDFHVRAHKAGIPLWKANIPFYHERSSTIKMATPEERAEIESQANRDRSRFFEKWGCTPWGAGYDALFQ